MWGVGDDPLVGRVGRLDPMKDHATFLHAAAIVHRQRGDVRFVCVGGGPAAYQHRLAALGEQLELTHCLVWAEAHDDMAGVYGALDLCCSSSLWGEGFPNVVAEAMACGTPCVVTDVGDSAVIVDGTGEIVAPGDPEAMAKAILRMLDRLAREHETLGTEVRERVRTQFGCDRLLEGTVRLLEAVT